MSSHSPILYLVLHVLFFEMSGNRDFIQERSTAWADHYEGFFRRYSRLFSEYDRSDLTSSIGQTIDIALQDRLLFVISEATASLVETYLEMCGVDFIGVLLECGHISLTPLGVSYITRIHNDIYAEQVRLQSTTGCPLDLTKSSFGFYSFAHRFQKGINKSHVLKNQTEFLISVSEKELRIGLADNSECYSQCGEIFRVNSWATQWWDIHHQGVGVLVQPVSSDLQPPGSGTDSGEITVVEQVEE